MLTECKANGLLVYKELYHVFLKNGLARIKKLNKISGFLIVCGLLHKDFCQFGDALVL